MASMRRRAARIATAVITISLVGTSAALACPVCFGVEDSPLVDGTKLGVWVMLAITLSLQVAFAGFFLYLRRRAKLIARLEIDSEWSDLQKAKR